MNSPLMNSPKSKFAAGESFAELFEQSLKTVEMKPGAIIIGVITDVDSEWVTVHAGLKSEGVIPKIQFLDDNGQFSLNVGDEVYVALEMVEDGNGATRLSREKARRMEAWKSLEVANETDTVVKGVISGKVKGGFTVEVQGIRAFLPGSASLRISSNTCASITSVSTSSRTDSTWTFSLMSSTVFAPRACQSSLPLPLGGFTDS